MEKLFSQLKWVFLFLPVFMSSQEYAVFKVKGTPDNVLENRTVKITNGNTITEGKITLKKDESLLLIADSGELYQMEKPGTYDFNDIAKFHKKSEDSRFSSKYLKYVWQQVTEKEKTKTHTGNVFRDGLIDILEYPADSASVFGHRVQFEWEPDSDAKQHYFLLRNNTTGDILKLLVEGKSLVLYEENKVLQKGNSYSWSVSDIEFPDMTRIKINRLNFLSREQYNEKTAEFTDFIETLKSTGHSQQEIDEVLCSYFKLCKG